MAHVQQLQFVKSVTRSLTDDYSQKNIIEIGSYDVNGSVRQFFKNSSYIGVDLIAGVGVDIVCEGDKVDHPDNIYDVAISCECFEHNPNWLETFENMHRITKEGGRLSLLVPQPAEKNMEPLGLPQKHLLALRR
jgi:SAM-dependent methyltransferase